jgi:excinuclease ABC subunit A
VEHDSETITIRRLVVDMVPGAGDQGGQVVVSDHLNQVLQCRDSLTADYLTEGNLFRYRNKAKRMKEN